MFFAFSWIVSAISASQEITVVIVSSDVDLSGYNDLQKPSVVRELIRLIGTVVFDMSVSDSSVNVVDDIKACPLYPLNSQEDLWWISTNASGLQAIDTLSYQTLEHGISRDYIHKKKYVIVQPSGPCKILF